MCRCIVPRYNYARMSAVRASRIVRTRYFNENWLQLAATRLLSTVRPTLRSWHSNRSACGAEISRRIARRGPSAGRSHHAGAAARLFSSWKIVKDRRAPPCLEVVRETTNTSNDFQGLRLSLVAARSKGPIVRLIRIDSISARDSTEKIISNCKHFEIGRL